MPYINSRVDAWLRKVDDNRHEHGSPRPQDIVSGSPRPMRTLADVKDRYGHCGYDELGREILRLNLILDAVETALDNEADAEILGDGPVPNDAMRFLTLLRDTRNGRLLL